MQVTSRSLTVFLGGVALAAAMAATASAQPTAVNNEVERLKGHWRVTEMIEDGRAIPTEQMPNMLPGGGVLEVVDMTILFKAPIGGMKSTRSFRLDATAYPKKIAILDRDTTTGLGIYKFDQGKLVICMIRQSGREPTEFDAPAGSGRSLVILERFDPGRSTVPGLNAKAPLPQPVEAAAPVPPPAIQAKPVAVVPAVPATPAPDPTAAVVAAGNASRILTDSDVHNMALGTWRMNDTEGSVDIVFDPAGTFSTYRYYRTLQNFHIVFAPTLISSGTWTIQNGRLIAQVTSSTRLDKVNQSYVPAVRSISATDMILVDHLGRVSRAVKLR